MAWQFSVNGKILAQWEGELTREQVVEKHQLKHHHCMLERHDYKLARNNPFTWFASGKCKLEWIESITTRQ